MFEINIGVKKTPRNFTAGMSSLELTLLKGLILLGSSWSELLLLQKISKFCPPPRPGEKSEFSFVRMQNKSVSAEKFANFPKLIVDNFC